MVEVTEAMKAAVVKVIFDSISEEERKKMIEDSIQSLLTVKKKDPYGRDSGDSPLSEMFANGVFTVAQQVIREKMQNDPELRKKIETLYSEAFTRIFETEREATITRMAQNISNALADIRDR